MGKTRPAPASAPSSLRLPRPRTLALIILVLALALRVWDIAGRSLWLDEAVEYWTATSPLAHLAASVREIIQDPPFYSFLLHFWMLPTNHEAWLRLLSVLFSVGSVAGVMVLGRRLQGWTSALAGGFLMAVLPTAIRYAQEAGQYAPMQCFLVWSLVALVGLVRAPGRGAFMRWGLFAVLAVYTYYGTIITLMIPFACVLVEAMRRRDRAFVRRALVTLAAFGIAVLPLLIYFIPAQLHRGPTEHALEVGTVTSLGGGLHDVVRAFQVTFAFGFTGWPCTRVPAPVTIVLFVALAAIAWRAQRRLLVWFIATWGVYAIIGWLHLFPFGFRHSLILSPLMVPIAALSVATGARGPWRAGAALGFALLCIGCLVSLPNRAFLQHTGGENKTYSWPETEDIGPVTKYWCEHRTPGQPTYVYYAAAPAFAYYMDRYLNLHSSRPSDWFLHCWRGEGTAPCADNGVYYGRWLRSMTTLKKVDSVFETMKNYPDEFWFVICHAQENEQMTVGATLHQHYDFIDMHMGRDAAAVLLRARPE